MRNFLESVSGEFLISYSTLLSIVNPFGMAFVFEDMTRWVGPVQQERIARRIGVYSFAVIVVSSAVGSYVLNFFGISMAALRIAGGLAVALAGWRLLNEPEPERKQGTPTAMDTAPVEDMVFFPLTMPLTTGPGTISAAIALFANQQPRPGGYFSALATAALSALAVAFTIYFCYRSSRWVSDNVGIETTRVVTRLAAFLILCVGVQIVLTGVLEGIRTNE